MRIRNNTFGEGGIKRSDVFLHPAANVSAYTYFADQPKFTPKDSAAYFIVGTDDWIVSWHDVKQRATDMEATEIDKFKNE